MSGGNASVGQCRQQDCSLQKAPGSVGSWASSGETLTPESLAGQRPSRASECDYDVSPNSEIGDLARCLPTDLSSSYSSDGRHVVRVVPCAPKVPHAPKENRSRTRPSGLRPAEMRRRKYFVDSGLRESAVSRANPRDTIEHSRSTVSDAARHTDSSQQDQTEVLVEGPLQQRSFWLLWSWRWCVLDSRELRVYQDQEASLLMSQQPLERHKAADLRLSPDVHSPSILTCSTASGETLTSFRAGPGQRWEELAAATLWLQAFATVSRSRSRDLNPQWSGAWRGTS